MRLCRPQWAHQARSCCTVCIRRWDSSPLCRNTQKYLEVPSSGTRRLPARWSGRGWCAAHPASYPYKAAAAAGGEEKVFCAPAARLPRFTTPHAAPSHLKNAAAPPRRHVAAAAPHAVALPDCSSCILTVSSGAVAVLPAAPASAPASRRRTPSGSAAARRCRRCSSRSTPCTARRVERTSCESPPTSSSPSSPSSQAAAAGVTGSLPQHKRQVGGHSEAAGPLVLPLCPLTLSRAFFALVKRTALLCLNLGQPRAWNDPWVSALDLGMIVTPAQIESVQQRGCWLSCARRDACCASVSAGS